LPSLTTEEPCVFVVSVFYVCACVCMRILVTRSLEIENEFTKDDSTWQDELHPSQGSPFHVSAPNNASHGLVAFQTQYQVDDPQCSFSKDPRQI
jgi:hypothetical protein